MCVRVYREKVDKQSYRNMHEDLRTESQTKAKEKKIGKDDCVCVK
jgi:hypothetical protein